MERPTSTDLDVIDILAEAKRPDSFGDETGLDTERYADPTCKSCHGEGYLHVEDGGAMKRDILCPCVTEGRRRHACELRIQSLFGVGGSRMTFKRYQLPDSHPNQAALKGAHGYVKHWPAFAEAGAGFAMTGKSGCGKAQPLHCKVLTPTGWMAMGEIKLGMQISDPVSGKSAKVTGVYPQGMRETYRIVFSDASTTECDIEHLWNTSYHPEGNANNYSTHTAYNLRKKLLQNPHRKLYIPLTAALEFTENPLSVSAWREAKSEDCECFIPNQYKYASKHNRIEFLQTIIDTKSWIDDAGKLLCNVSSIELANDIQEIVCSLGGTAQIKSDKRHQITILLPADVMAEYRTAQPTRWIVSIEPIGLQETQCIQVDSPDHLYITDDYIVTHNTHIGVATLIALIKRWPSEDGGLLSAFHLSMPELMRQTRQRIGVKGIHAASDPVEMAMTSAITLLDDVGAERRVNSTGTDMSYAEENLYIILNYRLAHGLPTLFTTNYSKSQLIGSQDVPGALDERVARRLFTSTVDFYPMRSSPASDQPPADLKNLLR